MNEEKNIERKGDMVIMNIIAGKNGLILILLYYILFY